jgi:hypothetical protein
MAALIAAGSVDCVLTSSDQLDVPLLLLPVLENTPANTENTGEGLTCRQARAGETTVKLLASKRTFPPQVFSSTSFTCWGGPSGPWRSCSKLCGAWSGFCGAWSASCRAWSASCGAWSASCGAWSASCGKLRVLHFTPIVSVWREQQLPALTVLTRATLRAGGGGGTGCNGSRHGVWLGWSVCVRVVGLQPGLMFFFFVLVGRGHHVWLARGG